MQTSNVFSSLGVALMRRVCGRGVRWRPSAWWRARRSPRSCRSAPARCPRQPRAGRGRADPHPRRRDAGATPAPNPERTRHRTPAPNPTPRPAPTARPAPTPPPTTTASSRTTTRRSTKLGVKVFFVECNGAMVPGSEHATSAQVGCRIHFDSTPKDAEQRPTRSRGTPSWSFNNMSLIKIGKTVDFTPTVTAVKRRHARGVGRGGRRPVRRPRHQHPLTRSAVPLRRAARAPRAAAVPFRPSGRPC